MKKQNLRSLQVVVLTCCCVALFCSSACAEIAGLYISEADRKDFLLLNADGAAFFNDSELRGTYTVNGKLITLTFQEESLTFVIDGDVVVAPDETRFRKHPFTLTPEEAHAQLEKLDVDPTEEAFRQYAEEGDLLAVLLCISAGMDVNVTGKDGETALLQATDKGQLAVVHVLLGNGADVNLADEYGDTALIIAADGYYKNFEMVQLLVDNGANVNMANEDGRTALMLAAGDYTEDVEKVQLLLDNGASVNTRDDKGETALMKAAERGHLATIHLLLDHGADANIASDDDMTALTKAAAEGYDTIVQLFEQSGVSVSEDQKLAGTMERMRAISLALGIYMVDHDMTFPIAEQNPIGGILFKDDPKEGLTRSYYDGPATDAWGAEFLYNSDGARYMLISLGSDGAEGGTGEFDRDIICNNGNFVSPE